MKSHEWPKPLWHKDYPEKFPKPLPPDFVYPYMAPNEQVYEAASQGGRRAPNDPEPPCGIWGWSKTYIPKSPYEVGQKKVLHGPKGTTVHSSSKEEEKSLLAQGWSLAPLPVSEEDMLTEAQKAANEMEEMRREMQIMREALSGRKGRHKDSD